MATLGITQEYIDTTEHERDEALADAKKCRDALDNLLGFLDDNNAYDKFSEHPIVRNRYTQVHNDGDRAVRGV